MSTASITHRPISVSAAAAAVVAAIALTGVAVSLHESGSSAPTTTQQGDVQYPVYSLERPWHSGTQPGMP
jgi:streptogramin lyase